MRSGVKKARSKEILFLKIGEITLKKMVIAIIHPVERGKSMI